MNANGLLSLRLTGVAAALVLASAASAADLPAFPGAEGFGAPATGGRGGEIVRVTSLNDKGPGSFRDAVSKPGRVVVFDVAGIIRLQSNIELPDNLTILGQTAPGAGVCLYGRSVSMGGAKNIIIRYVRFRQGIAGDRGKCSLSSPDGSNLMIDHCSIEWGRWDNLGCTKGAHDVTYQNCIIGEGLDPQRFGALVDSVENVTLSHNLWINNHSRNPKAKGTIQYINNVVYNWRITGLCGGHSAADHSLDVIGNYFIGGPTSNNRAIGQCTATDHIFHSGNLIDTNKNGRLDGEPATDRSFGDGEGAPTFVKAAWGKPPIPVTVDSAEIAYQKVLSGAGCSLTRDTVDTRLIGELSSLGTKGRVIDDEKDVGGLPEIASATPPKDSDHDGIPDAWEIAHHLNPNDPADAAKLDPSGYMMIELYANDLLHP